MIDDIEVQADMSEERRRFLNQLAGFLQGIAAGNIDHQTLEDEAKFFAEGMDEHGLIQFQDDDIDDEDDDEEFERNRRDPNHPLNQGDDEDGQDDE